jgi:archaea-specific DNA-binding protein
MPKRPDNKTGAVPETTESAEPAASTETQTQPRPQQMQQQQERRSPANHVYVGQKPVMSYAMSALIQLTQMGEIVIKARGLAISRAVDVAQIVTKRLGNGAFAIKGIHIDTEVVGEGAEMRNVSSIEIVVGK